MSKKDSAASSYPHFIGKSYQLSKHTVVIDDLIAEGGFSMVFLVKSNGKKYALKRMYVNNQQDLDACKLEINIIKTLSEKNRKILKYVDSLIQRQTDDIYEILLLTKYCRSGGLIQLMNDRLTQNSRLNESEILHIFCDLCEAVADLHQAGIIHRDIKIENILIDRDSTTSSSSKNSNSGGEVNFVLCDFGSATTRTYTPAAQQYSNSSIQALADEIQKYTTLAYRSPEMVDLYSSKPITTKSDIWAMGCLLYKMCYYTTPFGESLLAIQEGRFTLPDAKHHLYSKQLNGLIGYMLDPDPVKRPDVFHVAAAAFALAQLAGRQRSPSSSSVLARNMPSAELVLGQLPTPLTETEWRTRQQSMAAAAIAAKRSKEEAAAAAANTTVNPRERPKANLASGNHPIPFSQQQQQQQQQQALAAAAVAQRNANKITVSIKPPVHQQQQHSNSNQHSQQQQQQQQQQQSSAFSSPTPLLPPPPTHPTTSSSSGGNLAFGFEDDFSSLTTTTTTTSNEHQPQQQQQPHATTTDISSTPLTTINTDSMRKSHRRSASHSSTIFTGMTTPLQQQQPQNLIQTTTTNTPVILQSSSSSTTTSHLQQQQQQHQFIIPSHQSSSSYAASQYASNNNNPTVMVAGYGLHPNYPSSSNYHQQQQQQQQNQYMNELQQNVSAFRIDPAAQTLAPVAAVATTSSNRLINHSRSASASPNVAPAKLAAAAVAQQQAMRAAQQQQQQQQQQQLVKNQTMDNTNSTEANKVVSETSNKKSSERGGAGGGATKINPFDDNDDLFGLEFDRIRHKNELMELQKQQQQQQQGQIISASSSTTSAASSSSTSSNKKLNKKHHHHHHHQPDQFGYQASGVKVESSKKTSSSSSSRKRNQSLPKTSHQSANRNKKQLDSQDPFRNAPLEVFKKNNPNSSSSSESSSISTGSSSSNPNNSSSTTNNTSTASSSSNDNSTVVITTTEGSAFQPYRKQPDPFISAPFDEPKPLPTHTHHHHHHYRKNRRHSNENGNDVDNNNDDADDPDDDDRSSSSATPTQSRSNEEIIRVIGNKLHLVSPKSTSQHSIQPQQQQQQQPSSQTKNPFMEAPFTVKKPHGHKAMLASSNSASSISGSTNNTNFSSAFDSGNNKTPTLFDQDYFPSMPTPTTTTTASMTHYSFKIPASSSLHEIKSSSDNITNPTTTSTAFSTNIPTTSAMMSNMMSTPIKPSSASGGGSDAVKQERMSNYANSGKPSSQSQGQGGGGGISNMSFDEY